MKPHGASLAARSVDLLTVVAHDLRQPIAAALTATQLVEECIHDVEVPECVRKHVALAQRCMQHALTLATDLLAMEQARAGVLQLVWAPLDVAALLDDARSLIAPQAESRRIDVRVIVAPTLPRVSGDHARLLQVLANLAANAIRHGGSGGRITIEAVDERDAVRFAVADSGPGISEADLPHVFETFWRAARTARAARCDGAGLGLTIARWLVEAHAGRIVAEHAPGGGLRVAFTIPVRPPDRDHDDVGGHAIAPLADASVVEPRLMRRAPFVGVGA